MLVLVLVLVLSLRRVWRPAWSRPHRGTAPESRPTVRGVAIREPFTSLYSVLSTVSQFRMHVSASTPVPVLCRSHRSRSGQMTVYPLTYSSLGCPASVEHGT